MDPDTFEEQHDEELMRAVDETEISVEDTEDERDTDVVTVVLSDDEDTDPMLDTDTEEEDPEEDPIADDVASPYEADVETDTGDSTEDDRVIRSPLPAVRAPSPPPVPLSPDFEDDSEEHTPIAYETETAPPAEPDTPPPAPIAVISVAVHDWIVTTLTAELHEMEGRVAEARRELDAERAARFERRPAIPRTALRGITGIELRARLRIRALRGDGQGRVSRVEAEDILRRAMLRVRDMTRG